MRADQIVPPLALALSLAGCGDDAEDGVAAPVGPTPAACEAAADVGPVQLRLLTRREYNHTVADLFASVSGAPVVPAVDSCALDTDCDVLTESCVAGACAADPCNVALFSFDAGGAAVDSVHVAGSFNGWAATVEAGGYPMTYVPSLDRYVAKHALDDGHHTYKLVVDGSWIADPDNPTTEPDGFGGENSVLSLDCAAAPPSAPAPPDSDALEDPAAKVPVESRPPGYPFDNAAASGIVTAVHVEQYMRAAEKLAALAVADLDAFLPCDPAADPEACARELVTAFGERAFRRPLDPEEIDAYASRLLDAPDFATGVRIVIEVMLSSPYFLYRFEIGEAQADGTRRLTPFEVASALSYNFWGTMPDEALFEAARSGALDTPEGIAIEARRLLADERARDLLGVFALQWLGVEHAAELDKSPSLYPGYSPALADSMVEETRRFVAHVVFDGGGRYRDLLLAEHSFVDAELAALYGVDLEAGASGHAPIALPAERRAGLLGHASVLATYAHSDQTSPVRRGLFVRERLLCQHIGAPPPNAGGVPEVDPDATTRERFEQHSADPTCSGCHQHLDPIGFGFEHFDAIGAWRDLDAGKPVDASGLVTSVEGLGSGVDVPFQSLPALSSILAESESAPACFARQVARFSRGGFVGGGADQEGVSCGSALIEQAFAASGGDLRELLVATTQLPGFLTRRAP